jgi:hypothetical protein
MQDHFNRLSQKSYILAEFGQESPIAEAREAVENALLINPTMPAYELVEFLIKHAEPDLTIRLQAILERDFYLRAIRAHRWKQGAIQRAQMALPGFEHLDRNIPGPKGAPIRLLDANTRAVRQYCRLLMKTHRERKQKDPKIREALALLDKMRAASQTEKGITVRQVLLLEAR